MNKLKLKVNDEFCEVEQRGADLVMRVGEGERQKTLVIVGFPAVLEKLRQLTRLRIWKLQGVIEELTQKVVSAAAPGEVRVDADNLRELLIRHMPGVVAEGE